MGNYSLNHFPNAQPDKALRLGLRKWRAIGWERRRNNSKTVRLAT
jgi:hypothetical protein